MHSVAVVISALCFFPFQLFGSDELGLEKSPLLTFPSGTTIELASGADEQTKTASFAFSANVNKIDVTIVKKSCGCLNAEVKMTDGKSGTVVSVVDFGELEGARSDVIQIRAVDLDGSNRQEIYALVVSYNVPSIARVDPPRLHWTSTDREAKSVKVETTVKGFEITDQSIIGDGFALVDKSMGANGEVAVFRVVPSRNSRSIAALRVTIKQKDGTVERKKTVFFDADEAEIK